MNCCKVKRFNKRCWNLCNCTSENKTIVTETTRTEAHRFYASLGYAADAYKGFKKHLPADRPST